MVRSACIYFLRIDSPQNIDSEPPPPQIKFITLLIFIKLALKKSLPNVSFHKINLKAM